MPPKPVYIASDAHLGALTQGRDAAFARWLRHAGERASRIVLNGDIFDFWFEYRHAVPRGYTRVLGAMAELADAGVPVTFVGGNHDWWGGSFLEEEVGVSFHREPVVLDLAGRRTFLAHGDGLGKGDLGYRMLKLILSGRFTCWAFRWLHPDVGAWLAGIVSQSEHRDAEPNEADRGRARALEAWARGRLREDPSLDLVVLGHTHIPAVVEHEGRYYVNAGDWIHHLSYAVVEPQGPPRIELWRNGAPRPLEP